MAANPNHAQTTSKCLANPISLGNSSRTHENENEGVLLCPTAGGPSVTKLVDRQEVTMPSLLLLDRQGLNITLIVHTIF
jgi:hypothetical protein